MTSVTILSVPMAQGGMSYCAVSNGKRSEGATAGEALDALTAQLPDRGTGAVVIIQDRAPDLFFTVEQQQRLSELMARWHAAQDGTGRTLSGSEEAELDALIDAELQGAKARAEAFLQALKP